MRGTRFIAWFCFCGAALAAAPALPALRADEQPPADEKPRWVIHEAPGQVKQRRGPQLGYAETVGEEIAVQGARDETVVVFDRRLPKPGRVIPELTASVWVRANRVGARIYLHVVYPNQKDPATGRLLDSYIKGSEYSDVGRWQQLVCGTPTKVMESEIRLLRWRFRPEPIDVSGNYVDQVVVTCPLGTETLQIALGDPHVEPLIEVESPAPLEQPRATRPLAEIRQGQLEIAGRPRLMIMGIDHGEDPDTFTRLHLNTIWIRSANERARLAALHQRGIFAAAAPPTDPAPVEQLSAEGLRATPRAYAWPEILFWYLGTWMSSQDREDVVARTEQLRSHDYQLRRPTLIDVVEDERGYSRYVSILGTSRHIFGTAYTLKDYRNWLMERSRLANPGTYLFTWIQTEPVPASNDWRIQSGVTPAVMEPEQIRQQLYAAIMAGYRGFGYWCRTSLESNAPGAVERRLELAQLNLELGLIEPFLATASLTDASTFRIDDKTPKPTRKLVDFPRNTAIGDLEKGISQKLAENDTQQKNKKLMPLETMAAVFQGTNYRLVIASWLSHDAQFVPGKLAAYDAKVLIPEPSETAHFWELTTTTLRPLKKEKTVAHYLVTLPKFDQTAIILVSSDSGWRDQVEQHIQQIAPRSARISIDLAKAKLVRVRQVDAELTQLGSGLPDGPAILGRAERCIQEAEAALQARDFEGARSSAADAMQLMRVLQYAHWNEAVTQGEFGPISTPYTICFQTLPDHLRLIQRLGQTADNPQDNLLPSGDFESQKAIRAGWTQSQHSVEGVRSEAELYPSPHKGKTALQLIAVPAVGVDAPEIFSKAPVSVSSPAMPVRKGQILHVSGWVKVVAAPTRSLDAITVHDNIDRMLGAIRFTEKGGWQRFQILREVRADGPYVLTLTLHGLGEVLFDDLQVIPHQFRTIRAASDPDPPFEQFGPRGRASTSGVATPVQYLRPTGTR